jgi:hypothetical protein
MPMHMSKTPNLDSFDINPLSGKRVDLRPRPPRHARPICGECLRRPAIARVRRGWVALKDHDFCRQCWRARMDARRVRRVAA